MDAAAAAAGAADLPSLNDKQSLSTPPDPPRAVDTTGEEVGVASPKTEPATAEEAIVQMGNSLEAPVKADKEEAHAAPNDSVSPKGGYNLRHQRRGTPGLVDQPARLSTGTHEEGTRQAGKRGRRSRLIATGKRDEDSQTVDGPNKARRGRRRGRPYGRGRRPKLQKEASSEDLAQSDRKQKKRGAKRGGRTTGAARGRPRTHDPYRFNDNTSVPMVGRLMHVHPPKRVSDGGLGDDSQCSIRNVASECLASGGESVETSVEIPHEASVPIDERLDEQIQD